MIIFGGGHGRNFRSSLFLCSIFYSAFFFGTQGRLDFFVQYSTLFESWDIGILSIFLHKFDPDFFSSKICILPFYFKFLQCPPPPYQMVAPLCKLFIFWFEIILINFILLRNIRPEMLLNRTMSS